jgi:hypothetical protein
VNEGIYAMGFNNTLLASHFSFENGLEFAEQAKKNQIPVCAILLSCKTGTLWKPIKYVR